MRSYISYDELEELGETIVRAYINKTRRYNALCVDIEGIAKSVWQLTAGCLPTVKNSSHPTPIR